MHELSVAMDLVEIATEEAARLGGIRIAVVHVRAGQLSGIDSSALSFCFEAATDGTVLQGALLKIETSPVLVWCDACRAERAVVSLACRRCEHCNAIAPRVVRGEELELVGLEICDDDDAPARGSQEHPEQERQSGSRTTGEV